MKAGSRTKPEPMWRRYARFFGPDAKADVRDELRFHLESKMDDLRAHGWSESAARSEAVRQFGDLQAVEKIGVRIGGQMEQRKRLSDHWTDMVQDLRYTLRTLGRDPGFTAVSVVILALAIGANVAVFSVVNTMLLRPLPFPNSDRLVWIQPKPSDCGLSCATYTADAYEDLRAGVRTYDDITGYMAFSTPNNLRLTGHGEPVPATGIEVISNFFSVLGVRPEMGRVFRADEMKGAHPETILTDAYWRRQFQADPEIVGKAIELNGKPMTVIGVLPPSFDFGAVFKPGERVDLFTICDLDAERNWGNIVTLIGRMKPGVTLAQAKDDTARVAPTLYFNKKYPQTLGNYKGNMIPVDLKGFVTGKLRRSLVALWSAVGAILLIAGVNLSNLLLARAAARTKEFALRGALGASRGRIVRQLLLESLVLSAGGALAGLGLAEGLIAWLRSQGSIALPLLNSLAIDGQAVGWTVLIAFATAMLFGLLPGMRMASGNLQEALKDSSAGSGQSRKHERVRAVLVVTEIALACMLLVSAGLLLQSFMKVLDVDLGFEPSRAASIAVDYDASAPTGAESAAKLAAIFQTVTTKVSAIPGVEAVGISDYLPLGPNRSWGSPLPQGREKEYKDGEVPGPLVYVVSPGFMRAMGIRMEGRDFTWADGLKSQEVVMINRSMAKFFWPHESGVGKMLVDGQEKMLVVGVVDDVHEESVEGKMGAQIYYSALQKNPSSAQLVVRTQMKPSALAGSVLQVLREINPKQPAAEFKPVQGIVDRANSPRRFFLLLVAVFAGLGLLLAALGIYGVISYSVTQKTQEIGVKMALGASAGRVQSEVLRHTLRLAVIGVVIGTVASLAATRLIASLLFGTSPSDPLAYVGMAVAIGAVALISGYLPARRASRMDPMVALRAQ
jgi:predicted permease